MLQGLLGTFVTFVVKSGQFVNVAFQPVDLHRADRADGEDVTGILHPFYHFELFVVIGLPLAEYHAQARVIPVDEFGSLDVHGRSAVTAVAGENNHVEAVSRVERALYGDGIDDAAVKHRRVVHLDDGADERHAAGGLDDVKEAFLVFLLAEIVGPSGPAVGRDHLKSAGMLEVGVVVEGQDFVGNRIVHEFLVQDAALAPYMPEADEVVFLHQVDAGHLGASALMADVGNAVAGAGGNCNAVGEIYVVVEQVVECAAGEDAAHSAAFQH